MNGGGRRDVPLDVVESKVSQWRKIVVEDYGGIFCFCTMLADRDIDLSLDRVSTVVFKEAFLRYYYEGTANGFCKKT